MKIVHHRFRVPFHQLDPGGVLFHAHVFAHAHEAYEALMQALGWDLARVLREGTLAIPLAAAHASYLQPLRLDDQVEVEVRVAGTGRRSFTLAYHFRCGNETRVLVETTHVTVDSSSGRAVPLPPALAAALENYSRADD